MKERVLIVEDDKHISKLVKFNLEKANYECTIAATGEKALEVLADYITEVAPATLLVSTPVPLTIINPLE